MSEISGDIFIVGAKINAEGELHVKEGAQLVDCTIYCDALIQWPPGKADGCVVYSRLGMDACIEQKVDGVNKCEKAGFAHAWRDITPKGAFLTMPPTYPIRMERCNNCGLTRRLLVAHSEEWVYGDEEFMRRIKTDDRD